MKTTSSKLTRGVMIFAALLVPATTWWVSSHYYTARREAENRQQLARLQEIQEKYADSVKNNELLREAIQNEDKRRELFKGVDAGTTEFVVQTKQRSSWNWPTDPDHVWQDQRRRAGEMLIRLNATDQGHVRNAMPRRIPSR
jgi:hypothetical protein